MNDIIRIGDLCCASSFGDSCSILIVCDILYRVPFYTEKSYKCYTLDYKFFVFSEGSLHKL